MIKTSSRRIAAFTLIELIVSISIMILIILGIGLIFQTTSRAIGTSQATMEMLSNVRSVQQQLDRDIAGMDKNCFLIIQPGVLGYRHFDQISFISYGSFPNRTGAANSTPFTDCTVANAAFIWWGQLVLGVADQSSKLANPINPTGTNDADFMLGRNTIILIPQDAGGANMNPCTQSIPAFKSTATIAAIDYRTASISVTSAGDTKNADITNCRVAAAAILPSQIQQMIVGGNFTAGNYCYRFGSLRSPYDSGEAFPHQLVNAQFRMHPIALSGVSSFMIEWYGPPTSGTPPSWNNTALSVNLLNKSADWPTALRFTYHVANPSGPLANGRDFVQIVKIPG